LKHRRPRLVAAAAASLSPVVMYHGLALRYLTALRLLMRPLLNGGTLGGPRLRSALSRRVDVLAYDAWVTCRDA
jgi:hypothetical protein